MNDELSDFERRAVSDLRAAVAAPEPDDGHNAAGRRAAFLVIVIVVGVGGVVAARAGQDSGSSVVVQQGTETPGSNGASTSTSLGLSGGSQLMVAQVDTLREAAAPEELPPIVAPVDLPPGWSYDEAESSSRGGPASLRLSYRAADSEANPQPTVIVCITAADDGCPPPDEAGWTAVDLEVDGFDGRAQLLGTEASLDAWQTATWTTEVDRVRW